MSVPKNYQIYENEQYLTKISSTCLQGIHDDTNFLQFKNQENEKVKNGGKWIEMGVSGSNFYHIKTFAMW